MTISRLKATVAIGAIILGFGFAMPAKAADNQTITATLTNVGALDVLAVAQMNFGTWYIINAGPAGDVIQLVKATTGGVSVVDAGAGSATSIVSNSTPAQLTVGIDGGLAGMTNTVVDMVVTGPTAFSDNDAVLSDLTYRTATENAENPITADGLATHPVTIAVGNVPEPVFFGGTVTIDDALNTGALTSTFNASFAY